MLYQGTHFLFNEKLPASIFPWAISPHKALLPGTPPMYPLPFFCWHFSRDDLKKAIEDNGGKVGSSISTKTDYVVAGDNMGPTKLDKANKLNIAIISEDDFIKLINETDAATD